MIIIPAIDLIDGRPVRLYQGDYDKKEIVADSASKTAEEFAAAGAEYIHVVDLDGARSGRPVNGDTVSEIVKACGIPVEIGGGIRSMNDIEYYLGLGVSRIILGTAAVSDPEFLKESVTRFKDRIAVGLDCRDGYACVSGWYEKSDLHYISFAKTLEQIGVRTIIFTDISRDGTLYGPNLEMLKELKNAVGCQITASGGIRNLEHIRALKELDIYGAITGKAVYTKDLDLKEAVWLCREDV